VKRAVVDFLRTHFGLSIRRSCRLALLPRSTYLYEKQPNGEEKILAEMKTILSKNTKYGSGMVHLKLRQQGLMINHKRVERIYREKQPAAAREKAAKEDRRNHAGSQSASRGTGQAVDDGLRVGLCSLQS
jgi:putative transposase